MRVKMLAVAGAVAATTALTGAVLMAQEPRGSRGADRAALRAEIGLSDEQAAQIREIHTGARKAAIARNADLRIARMELSELMRAATLDEAAIAARVARIGELQATALKARTESMLAVRRLVSAEQFEKMQQARRHERRARPARRERGPRGGSSDGGEQLSPLDPA